MKDLTVEGAERKSHARAVLMALAAAILATNAMLVMGDPNYGEASWRGASWVVLGVAWLILLANGGGLGLRGRVRELLNDELFQQNRSSAYAWGFVVTHLTALSIYLASWGWEISLADAIRLATSIGLATALLRLARLEWK